MVLLFQLNAHMKNKKQIKCVKERALGDKAEVCEASFEELGYTQMFLYIMLSYQNNKCVSGRIFKTTKKV